MTSEISGSDEAILERIHSGDPEGLVRLYETHAATVRALLARLVGPAHADDLTQEVFIRAAAHIGTFRGESSLAWWLKRIAANCAMRHLRSLRNRPTLVLQEAPAEPGQGPEQRVLEAEERADALRALQRMPAPDRHILVLREVLDLSYEEIRERLDLRFVGTVRSRLHKAREVLRRVWSSRRS